MIQVWGMPEWEVKDYIEKENERIRKENARLKSKR